MNAKEYNIIESHKNKIMELIKKKSEFDIWGTSGSIFYTGYGTLLKPNGVYLLGINPGGSKEKTLNVEEQFEELLKGKDCFYNAYKDEDWGKNNGLQRAVEGAFKKLNLCLRETCGSNLIFERTGGIKELKNKYKDKINDYYNYQISIHDYIINNIINPSVIISFGGAPYKVLSENWKNKQEEEDDLKRVTGITSPKYIESKDGDKILCYFPHSSFGHYDKFITSPHAEETLKKMRSKIHEKLDKRDMENPPKWQF